MSVEVIAAAVSLLFLICILCFGACYNVLLEYALEYVEIIQSISNYLVADLYVIASRCGLINLELHFINLLALIPLQNVKFG